MPARIEIYNSFRIAICISSRVPTRVCNSNQVIIEIAEELGQYSGQFLDPADQRRENEGFSPLHTKLRLREIKRFRLNAKTVQTNVNSISLFLVLVERRIDD